MVSGGSLKTKTFYLNAKCSVTDIFYPVESSLTLKLSIQKLNGVNPFSLSPLAEGICQKIVAIFMGGEN